MRSIKTGAFFKSKAFSASGMKSGALAGFLFSFVIIILKQPCGFAGLAPEQFRKLWPLMVCFSTAAGTTFGYICCRLSSLFQGKLSKLQKRSLDVQIFLFGFTISTLVQQLCARDALGPPGWYDFGTRFGGGPLGEPNVETIATGFLAGIYLLSLTRTFSKMQTLTTFKNILTVIKISLPGLFVWAFIYSIFVLFVSMGFLKESSIPFSSSALFIFEFPHPERIALHFGLSYLFTTIILYNTHTAYKEYSKRISTKDQTFLEKINDIVQEKLSHSDFSAEQLAQSVGISKGHLNRKLNELTETNTTMFILNARLEKAATLIKEDHDSITQIAYEVGFNNLSHFNKSFKNYFNTTPSKLKKQYFK